MRLRRLLLALMLVLLLGMLALTPVHGQGILGIGDGERWYFVHDFETDIITAFTLAGETRVVATNAPDMSASSLRYRIDAQTMLVTGDLESAGVLPYLLTADEGLLPFSSALPEEYIPVHYAHPYLVATSTLTRGRDGEPVALLDVEERRVILLNGVLLTVNKYDCCRFSPDGRYLWYIALIEPGNDAVHQLRELDLNTLTERVIYLTPDEDDNRFWMVPTADRAFWLQRSRQGTSLLQFSETGELVSEAVIASDNETAIVPFQDHLLISQFSCEADCTLEVRPIAGGESRFLAAPPDAFTMQLLYLSERGLVGLLDEQYLELSVDAVTLVGEYEPVWIQLPVSTTPDGRFMLMLDDQDELGAFLLRDNRTGEVVATIPITESGRSVMVMEASNDFVSLFDFGGPDGGFYGFDPTTGDLTSLFIREFADRTRLLEILPDGRALVLALPPRGRGADDEPDTGLDPPGIYRFDIATETFTLLVAAEVAFLLDGPDVAAIGPR